MITSVELANFSASENLLKNKIILISGAGDGIGRAAALSFAQHGATIILVGRTLSKLESVYDEIEVNRFPQPAIFPMNFESALEQDYKALVDAIEEEFGRLDGILHNAAELGPRTPLAQYPIEHFEKIMRVNVTAPFLLTKALIPLLERSGSGSVLFTGSSVGKQGRAYWGAYGISKAANENMMQIFADEYEASSKLRFNSINPGATRTRMRATAFPAEDPTTLCTPESLMNRYLYLLSDESQNVKAGQFTAQP